MPLTLAQWEAISHPDGTTEYVPAEMDGRLYSALDLRAPDQDEGWCFVAFSGVEPSSHIHCCDDGEPLETKQGSGQWQSYWMQATGRALMGSNLADALTNIFSAQADETGSVYNCPALPRRGERVLDIHIGPYRASTAFVPVQAQDPRVIPALRMHQRDYAAQRQIDVNEARRSLTRFMERYGLSGEEWKLVQTEAYASDGGPLPHNTTVTDDFSGTLSAWTQLAGTWTIDTGKLKADASSHRHIRYDTDLGSDHYSQAVISDNLSFPGVAIRDQNTDSSTVNRYVLHTAGASTTRLRRYSSAGAFSNLATYGGIALGSTIKLDGNGSTIEAFDDGVSLGTVTDSTYSGPRPGLYMYGTTGRLDDFKATDETVHLAVAAGNADADESDDGSAFNATNGLYLQAVSSTTASLRKNTGLVFDSVSIPQGSTIDSARLTVRIYTTQNNPSLQIHTEAVDDADDFTTTADVTSRARSTAWDEWEDSGLPGFSDASIDVSSCIEELVNRSGWVSGNSMCLLLCGKDGPSKSFWFRPYESGQPPARLRIEYSAGGGGGGISIPVVQHYRQRVFA